MDMNESDVEERRQNKPGPHEFEELLADASQVVTHVSEDDAYKHGSL